MRCTPHEAPDGGAAGATATTGPAGLTGLTEPTVPTGLTGLTRTGIGDEAAEDIAGQIAVARELGWDCLELRTVDGLAIAELPEAAFAGAAARLADAGLAVVAVDSRIGGWSRPAGGPFAADLRELDVLARRCARLGTRLVRVMSWPNDRLDEADWAREVLRRTVVLAERAADAGLVLLHENCAGWAGADASRALRLLEATGGRGYGLLFDTGNGAAYGYTALGLLRGLLPAAAHIHHVHVKDAVVDAAGVPHYRAAGEGGSAVAEVLRTLAGAGYTGALSVEPHLAVLPHLGQRAEPARCRAEFIRAAHALDRLIRCQETPAAGRSAVEGGVP